MSYSNKDILFTWKIGRWKTQLVVTGFRELTTYSMDDNTYLNWDRKCMLIAKLEVVINCNPFQGRTFYTTRGIILPQFITMTAFSSNSFIWRICSHLEDFSLNNKYIKSNGKWTSSFFKMWFAIQEISEEISIQRKTRSSE